MALAQLCGDRKVLYPFLLTSTIYPLTFLQVGIVDLDICGPSIPKLLHVEKLTVVNTEYGWTPLLSVRT